MPYRPLPSSDGNGKKRGHNGRISSLSIGFPAGYHPSRYRDVGRPKQRWKEHQRQEEKVLLRLNLNGLLLLLLLLLFIYLFIYSEVTEVYLVLTTVPSH